MRAKLAAALIPFALALSAAPLCASGPDRAPARVPVRGVWMHPGHFGPDEAAALAKMRETLDAYGRAGINTLIMLVKNTSGHVYFATESGVRDAAYGWDLFGALLAEARKRGMEVQPWFCVFPESSLLGRVREHPEWLISSPRREMVGAVNPALPAARAYEIGLVLELVRRYDVGWVHLDYIRYPCEPDEPYFGFDPETLRLFRSDTGIDLAEVRARDTGNPHWNAWLRWNTDRVTVFLRELRAALGASGRAVKVSAAVFPDAASARVMIGQDWAAWAREGLVDMLNPMLYTNDARLFETLAREAVDIGRGRTLVCPGLGVGTSHNRNTPEGLAEQTRLSGALGADGVVYFSAGSLTPPFLERLAAVR